MESAGQRSSVFAVSGPIRPPLDPTGNSQGVPSRVNRLVLVQDERRGRERLDAAADAVTLRKAVPVLERSDRRVGRVVVSRGRSIRSVSRHVLSRVRSSKRGGNARKAGKERQKSSRNVKNSPSAAAPHFRHTARTPKRGSELRLESIVRSRVVRAPSLALAGLGRLQYVTARGLLYRPRPPGRAKVYFCTSALCACACVD